MCGEQVLDIMARNRRRFGTPWVKIRRDRVGKLVTSPCAETVVQELLEASKLRECQLLDKDSGTLIPAVRLGEFEYLKRMNRR